MMTSSIQVATVILLSLFLVTKQNDEGQDSPLFMHPNDDDQVLQVGATLNLSCSINTDKPFNITWSLPDQFVGNKILV